MNALLYGALLNLATVYGTITISDIALTCAKCDNIKDCDLASLIKSKPDTVDKLTEWLAKCKIQVAKGVETSLTALITFSPDVSCTASNAILVDTIGVLGTRSLKGSPVTFNPAVDMTKSWTFSPTNVGATISGCTFALNTTATGVPLKADTNGLTFSETVQYDGEIWAFASSVSNLKSPITVTTEITITSSGDGDPESHSTTFMISGFSFVALLAVGLMSIF